jgi:hypothetical protein
MTVVTVAVQENDDPALRRTSECLRNLQESEQSRLAKGKSKVADMAEAANLSGNDIMGYSNDKNNDTNGCQDGL